MNIYYVHPLPHVEGMLMAYLPKEKIADRSRPVRFLRRERHANSSESGVLQSRAEARTGCGNDRARFTGARCRGTTS